MPWSRSREGDLVGSLCFAERGTVAYVWGNYVHSTCQRSGVGTALIRQAAQDMVLANRINLLTVDDGAFAVCRKLGFVDEGPGEVELFKGLSVPARRLATAIRNIRLNPRL